MQISCNNITRHSPLSPSSLSWVLVHFYSLEPENGLKTSLAKNFGPAAQPVGEFAERKRTGDKKIRVCLPDILRRPA